MPPHQVMCRVRHIGKVGTQAVKAALAASYSISKETHVSIFKKAFGLALAALAPLAAHATVPDSTFQFYFDGSVFDQTSSAPSYTAGSLGVTIRGYVNGTQTLVDQRWDGLGVTSSNIFNVGEITSGESLVLTFNKAVNLSSLRFSLWENGLFDSLDHATISWGNTTVSLGNSNDNGLLLKTFALTNAISTTFTITGTGVLSSFRLAGINATAAVPEPATYALMGLGLVGIMAARRRQQA
jgi:hypothetical protein